MQVTLISDTDKSMIKFLVDRVVDEAPAVLVAGHRPEHPPRQPSVARVDVEEVEGVEEVEEHPKRNLTRRRILKVYSTCLESRMK